MVILVSAPLFALCTSSAPLNLCKPRFRLRHSVLLEINLHIADENFRSLIRLSSLERPMMMYDEVRFSVFIDEFS